MRTTSWFLLFARSVNYQVIPEYFILVSLLCEFFAVRPQLQLRCGFLLVIKSVIGRKRWWRINACKWSGIGRVVWSDVESNRGNQLGVKLGVLYGIFVGRKVVQQAMSKKWASAQMKDADNMTDRSKSEGLISVDHCNWRVDFSPISKCNSMIKSEARIFQ